MIALPQSLGPILCAPLLRVVDGKLVELLRSLAPEEWDLATIAPSWRVRDVAAHLLDTPLRKLSMVRDGWVSEAVELHSEQDLVALVNRLNREGVVLYRRLSPPVLIGLMEWACAQSAAFHEALDPFAAAAFAVSWAGESASLNWFDTARELTERWHHQQQIRLAANRPGLMTPSLYHPVLDCFLRGLPHAFRSLDAVVGTLLAIEISGKCGGQWHLLRHHTGWRLTAEPPYAPAARVVIPQEIAWRVFTKGIDRGAALRQIAIEGDRELGEHVLSLTAIVG
jgi:Mycothiol maleylpyruvate isomerase N-terminal domain